MMIDAQGDASQQLPPVFRQHSGRRHVHGNQGVAGVRMGLGQSVHAIPQERGDPVVLQQIRRFSKLPQSQAQRRRRTDGISVRAGVGQDAEPVPV